MTLPQIKKYSQITLYLQDYFQYRKSLDPKFSFDIWAAELGFKSRTYMRLLCQGKRPMTPKSINIFSRKMSFSESEERHLTLLASYDKARTEPQKKIYQEKILEATETDEPKYNIKDYVQFLSSPTHLQLVLLITFDDFLATNKNLKKVLGLSESDLKKSLMTLNKLGLIEYKNKVWTSSSKSFKLKGETKDKAYSQFHLKTFKEAAEILKSKEMFKRFRSIYFSLAEESNDDLFDEIEIFMTKMKRKYASHHLRDKRLIKLNLQAYPISQLYTE